MKHCHSTPVPFRTQATIRRLVQEPGLPLARYLSSEQVVTACRAAGHGWRERLYSPAVTLWMFLTQMLDPDHSCRKAVARFLAYRLSLGLRPCSSKDGAYSEARSRLPEQAVSALTRHTGHTLAESASPAWLWHGRQVKIVDGTGLSMPDTPTNRKNYPLYSGSMFPVMRLVVVFSLAVGAVLDAAMGAFRGKGNGELSLLRQLGDIFQRGDVWLADRLYPTFSLIVRALAAGADIVMRMPGNRKPPEWRCGRRHKKGDKRVWWRKPDKRPEWMSVQEYHALPKWIVLRALRVNVRRRGFRTQQLLLVTTLTDDSRYSVQELADLYRRRWQAELDLRSLKQTLQMDILRGKSPQMVRKEVWAHLLAYNLVRSVMAEAAKQVRLRPDELSFAGAWQTIHAFAPYLRNIANEEQAGRLWQGMLAAISCHRVDNRPDRVEPRAVKRRPKKFPKLKGSRAAARRWSRRKLMQHKVLWPN